MIQYTQVDGRPATVAYLNEDFALVDPDKATRVKVIFDDGTVWFGVSSPEVAKYNPNQPRDEGGRWSPGGGGGGGSAFVSPNLKDLSFNDAVGAMSGARHKLLAEATADIHKSLGLKSTTEGVVGAWSDGAENSFMSDVAEADMDTLRLAAAMQGSLADQKAVLIFKNDPDGSAIQSSFNATGTIDQIHANLLEDGLAFHTLVPTADGARVVIVDLDGSMGDQVAKGASRYGAQVKLQLGQAEFVGTQLDTGSDREIRDDARRAYSEVISGSPVRGAEEVWRGISDRWGPTFEVTKYDPDQSRDDHGKWSTTGGGRTLVAAPGNRDDWPEHLKEMRIPPAWTDLRINPDVNGALLVVGKDSKGRDQYVYSEEFAQSQSATKFARVNELLGEYDAIADENAANLGSDNPSTVAHAEVMAVVMTTGIRPGSTEDTGADRQAYGATTIEGRHVVVDGSNVSLEFVGKKGVDLSIPITDATAARVLMSRASATAPDAQLFPEVTDRSLSRYSSSLGSGGYKTKDFRTALGTRTARQIVAGMNPPSNAREYRKSVLSVARSVSQTLGNTPAVALQSYIDPTTFADWRSGAGA